MKRVSALAGLAFAALVLQAAVARILPPQWCPDLGLLVVVGLGLGMRNATTGVVLAALVGYLSDALSGSLLGQHMLLHMAAFAAARIGTRQLNLRGPAPLAVFTAGLSAGYLLALWAIVVFFARGAEPSLPAIHDFVAQALVNGLLGPIVAPAVAWVSLTLGDEEGARLMRLEPRKFPA